MNDPLPIALLEYCISCLVSFDLFILSDIQIIILNNLILFRRRSTMWGQNIAFTTYTNYFNLISAPLSDAAHCNINSKCAFFLTKSTF